MSVNWSEELEEFHEESSRDHSLEVLTRRVMLDRLGVLPASPIVVDLGCSTGYLLEDLHRVLPDGRLVGIDLVMSGLKKASQLVPAAIAVQGDACRLPVPDGSVDALVSANLLEHVPDDVAALREIFRVLRPGAPAVIVVPASPGLYDYYDRFLHHERRYGRNELARKAFSVGLAVEEDTHIGASVFPAFWVVKKRNRFRFDHLEGKALEERVRADYAGTQDSWPFRTACRLDEWLLRHHHRMPAGIRGLTVLRRPEST
jgi:SAM-dependent methyltransferase